jgi:hypothetical protein
MASADARTYCDAVTRHVKTVMAEQDAALEAAVKAVSDNPTDLQMAEGWVDGEYHVEATHVPSGISVTVRTTVTRGSERVVQAEAFHRLRCVLNAVERYQCLPWPVQGERRGDGQH